MVLKPFCSLPSLLFLESQNNTFLHRPGGGGAAGKSLMSSVGITIRDSPLWSSIYRGGAKLGKAGGDLLIYGRYAGYPGRETLNTLIPKRFVSNEIWII